MDYTKPVVLAGVEAGLGQPAVTESGFLQIHWERAVSSRCQEMRGVGVDSVVQCL